MRTLVVICSMLLCCQCQDKLSSSAFEFLLSSKICSSRMKAVKALPLLEQKVSEIQFFKKNCHRLLTSLKKNLDDNNISLEVNGRVHLIDCYDFESNFHEGIIWSSSRYVVYRWNTEYKVVSIEGQGENLFSNYPMNSQVDINVLSYFNENGGAIFPKNLPASGRTNGGFCMYSEFQRKELVKSVSFLQY